MGNNVDGGMKEITGWTVSSEFLQRTARWITGDLEL